MKVSGLFINDISVELNEAFDRTLDYIQVAKVIKHDTLIVVYAIKDTDPEIKVQLKIKVVSHPKFLSGKKTSICEVTFFTEEHGFHMLNTSSTGKALSILATVMDICELYFSQISVWFFTAKLLVPDESGKEAKEIKSKSMIYSRLAKKMDQKHNLSFQSFSIKEDTGFILHDQSNELTKNDIVSLYNEW